MAIKKSGNKVSTQKSLPSVQTQKADVHSLKKKPVAEHSRFSKSAKADAGDVKKGIKRPISQQGAERLSHARSRDLSASRAVADLNASPRPISGANMEKAIVAGTQDLDNQAAGKEYDQLSNYVNKNWGELSPNAKSKWRVYENKAQDMRAQGKTGIPTAEYDKMTAEMHKAGYQDQTAGKAIEDLRTKGSPISGDDMQKAIVDATSDLDSQAAGREYNDLKEFVDQNKGRLSPDAKAKWGVYDKAVQEAKGKGQTGIAKADYSKMVQDMKMAGYEDKGAGKAIEELKTQPQPISGDDMQKAIVDATKDWDGQAAGKEFLDLNSHVKKNWDNLSPDAKAKWEVYDKTVQKSMQKGMKGIPAKDYKQMVKDMNATGYQDKGAGKAVEELKTKPQPISGKDMQNAIIDATKDFDAQAAGKEYGDLKNYVDKNWGNLSNDAKASWRTYSQVADKNKAAGRSGIPAGEYFKMVNDLKTSGYKDQGAGAAIEKLETEKRPVSGEAMEKAIVDGTKDWDAQAAGTEFQDLNKYVKQNWNELGPEAKAKWQVYEGAARKAQANGMTGIPASDYNQMVKDMTVAGYEDKSTGKAIEHLKTQPQPITGAALEKAIVDGTKDLDAQAAGKEHKDLSNYVKDNWNSMSPDAKAKWGVYDNAAKKAQGQGLTGIPTSDYNNMVKDMKVAQYADKGAGAAIEELKTKPQPISGQDLQQAVITATRDTDGQAAGKEFQDLKQIRTAELEEYEPRCQSQVAGIRSAGGQESGTGHDRDSGRRIQADGGQYERSRICR